MSSQIIWTTASDLCSDYLRCFANDHVVAIMPYVSKVNAQRAIDLMLSRAGAVFTILAVQDDLGEGPMLIWNHAFNCTHSEFVIYCAEDAFAGRYWLRLALQTINNTQAGLLAFNDGKWFGQLAAFGLVRRAWVEQVYQSCLFYSGYKQHYGDTELSWIAKKQNTLAYNPNALLVEVDYFKDQKETNVNDLELFKRRVASGFDDLNSKK